MYLYNSSRLLTRVEPITFLSKRFVSNLFERKQVPSTAEIVIAGGGLVGNSVAYHLTKCGWKDILILEQGQAGCGTSWHGAGLCGSVKGSKTQIDMALYGIDLYSKFEEETGVSTGFKQCGSLYLASTKDREIALKRSAALVQQHGVECHVIGPKEARDLNPLLNIEGIKMALWSPKDGVVNPTDLIQAYLKGSTKNGAKIFEGVTVNGFKSNENRITGVDTDQGVISCDKFINCTGLWARELGLKSDPVVNIPLHACEHYLIITKALNNIDPMMPVTRDYDSLTYLREWSGGLLAGGFETNARGTFFKGIPSNFQFQLLEEDWDHFGPLMEGLLHRYPCFESAEIRQFTNGPESFTPDGLSNVSKSTAFSNYFIAAGMNSNGIINSAGVGRAMAELITYGESQTNINNFDLRRVTSSSKNKLFCHDKAAATLSVQYALNYPKTVLSKPSPKNSPIHYLLDNKGAVWGSFADWAKPHYFKSSDNDEHLLSFGKPSWLHNVQSELKSCKKSVSFFDLSSKSKFNLTFRNNTFLNDFLEKTCAHKSFDESRPKGIIDTVIQDIDETAVAAANVFQFSKNSITITTEANQHTFLLSRLINFIEEYPATAAMENSTGKYAIFGLVGPNADDLLSELLSPPFATTSIKLNECDVVDLGYASNVLLARYFMKGIDGWQIIVPTEYSQGLCNMIMQVGESFGVKNAGSIALDSLRIRHMIPSYGSEFSLSTNKTILSDLFGNFEKKGNVFMTQIEINLPSSENWPWGGEQVMIDEHIVGNISSVGYTEENNKVLGLSLLERNSATIGKSVSVIVGEEHYEGKIIQIL